jgi:hypothetical protein
VTHFAAHVSIKSRLLSCSRGAVRRKENVSPITVPHVLLLLAFRAVCTLWEARVIYWRRHPQEFGIRIAGSNVFELGLCYRGIRVPSSNKRTPATSPELFTLVPIVLPGNQRDVTASNMPGNADKDSEIGNASTPQSCKSGPYRARTDDIHGVNAGESGRDDLDPWISAVSRVAGMAEIA